MYNRIITNYVVIKMLNHTKLNMDRYKNENVDKANKIIRYKLYIYS